MKITLAVCDFKWRERSQESLSLLRNRIPIAALHLAPGLSTKKMDNRKGKGNSNGLRSEDLSFMTCRFLIAREIIRNRRKYLKIKDDFQF
jgi:hypothetical protein